MKMQTIAIHNWRSIKDVNVVCEDEMIYIGQNNHGKSNILSAILFFLGQIGLDPLDFNGNSTELFVEITFCKLDGNDQVTFQKYLSSKNTIRVRKQAQKNIGFEYHGYIETPEYEWLREDLISQFTKREVAQTLPLSNLLPPNGRISADAFREAQVAYIESNRSNIKFGYELETSLFLGAKNVAKGIFGDVYFLPSIKRASDELTVKSTSIFGDLYARVINTMSITNPDFKDAKQKIINLIKTMNKTTENGQNNPRRPVELLSFEQFLSEELKGWNTSLDVEVTPPDIDELFKMGTTIWVDDGVRTDISRKGQGLQRGLIFALIRSLAKIQREERQRLETASTASTNRQVSKSAYFIFEEPELYLHPQAQRALYESLDVLSKADIQVMICTHSSSFINIDKYKSICIVRKNSIEEGTTAFQCKEELFDQDEKQAFNLAYWINPDRSELFFAKKVILLEGVTDKVVIPYLANNLGVFRHDYTLIDCGSKSTMPTYLSLLNKFMIPYVVVYDKDHQADKSPDAKAVANRDSQSIESKVDSTLGQTIILDNDIEEELGIIDKSLKNKPLYALHHVKSSSFVFSDALKQKIQAIFL